MSDKTNDLARQQRRDLMFLRSLCIEMRIAQVEYFANKSSEALVRAKTAEKRLDEALFGKALRWKDATEAAELLERQKTEIEKDG